jgi:protein phosphatase
MTPPRAPIFVTVRARTDLGRTRDHNEDAFLVADLTARTTNLTDGGPHRVGEHGTVFLVADGMGGAAAGELASSMAAERIFRNLVQHAGNHPAEDAEGFAQQLKAAVEEANEHIHAYSKEHPDVRGMGTTATVAGVLGATLYLAQVGDSRGYLVRDGVATQITKDQSLMQRLVDAGELTEEEAEQSERRNIILQALGPDAKIRVDLTWQELRRGDTLVICSDGLSGQVKREEIASLIETQPDLDRLCDELIARANERGGPDNITVVLARFEGDGLQVSTPSGEVGYHSLSKDDSEDEIPVRPAPAPPPPPPPAPVEMAPPPAPPARSGSPAVIAALTGGILVILVILYFLLRH